MKLKLGVVIALVCLIISCNTRKTEKNSHKETISKINTTTFTYQKITGVGIDSVYNRRDNSDIIKVNNTYYMWYTRMDSPVTSGYWGTIWYATSQDEGHTWQEKGLALGLGKEGAFDSHSVFTPNILAYHGKYYLYYTGVKPTPGNKEKAFEGNSTTDITALGLAVSDSPDGPFIRVENNPVLEISDTNTDFDSFRIDDASMMVRDNKVWLYYKGRSIIYGKSGPRKTQMGVAFSDTPEGPFVKNETPLIKRGHEVLVWNQNEGVASLSSLSKSVYWAADGKNFNPIQEKMTNIPMAPGLYRPHLEDGQKEKEIPGWGIAMVQKKGLAYLVRFEM